MSTGPKLETSAHSKVPIRVGGERGVVRPSHVGSSLLAEVRREDGT